MLARGGRVGTVTWTRDGSTKADEIGDATLSEADARPLPARSVDAGHDSADSIHALLTCGPTRVWLEPLRRPMGAIDRLAVRNWLWPEQAATSPARCAGPP